VIGRVTTNIGELSTIIGGPKSAPTTLVLGHGAGAGMKSDFMEAFASGVARRGVSVWRFNFPYAERGTRAPDRAPVLEEAFRAVAAAARERASGPLLLGGKSLGGRIASHLAAAQEPCAGLVLLGYPLHPPGKPERLRIEHLPHIRVPTLFVEGTRDPFCPLPTLRRVLEEAEIEAEVAVIEDGDHSLTVIKASGSSTADAWEEVVDVVADWIDSAGL
jgi:uncharacterized protein